MGRQPCCDKIGLKRGPWTIEEDQKLINFILKNGIICWRLVPKLSDLKRCGKSCRLRWTNYLRPDLKRGAFSESEEDEIIQLHSRLGNRWSKIASHFPGRTDNEIKNHWNTQIKKKLKILGVDPVTHKPIQPEQSHDSNSNRKGECIAESKDQDFDVSLQNEKGIICNEEILDATDSVLESINAEEMKNTQVKSSHSSNTSFSIDGESSIEVSNFCWDDTIDSFTSWEAIDFLEDVLSFMNFP